MFPVLRSSVELSVHLMGEANAVDQNADRIGQEKVFLPLVIVVLSSLISAFHSTSGDPSLTTSVPGNSSSSAAAASSSSSVYLGCGMTGNIRCPLRPNPPDVVIVWLKDDRPMDLMTSSVAKRLRMDKRGNIVIRTVQVIDEGRYTCSTYSPMSTSIRSPTIQVLVRGESMPASSAISSPPSPSLSPILVVAS